MSLSEFLHGHEIDGVYVYEASGAGAAAEVVVAVQVGPQFKKIQQVQLRMGGISPLEV